MLGTEPQLRGLGGWLILLAIALISMPGNLALHIHDMQQVWSQPEILAYTNPGDVDFDPRWRTLGWIETTGHAIAIIPAVFLVILFFFKHKSFPIISSVFASFLILVTGARLYLVMSIPTVAPEYRSAITAPSIASLGAMSAWIAYMFRSERVRLTFTRRFYFTPFFPFFTAA